MTAPDELPWICGLCGHFCVTTAADRGTAPPPHHCRVAGRSVQLAPYESTAQAERIARRPNLVAGSR